MRSIEVLFLLLLSASLIAWCLPQRRVKSAGVHALVGAAVAAGLLHLAVESGRWQLVPAYVLAILCVAFAVIGRIRGQAAREPSLTRRADTRARTSAAPVRNASSYASKRSDSSAR